MSIRAIVAGLALCCASCGPAWSQEAPHNAEIWGSIAHEPTPQNVRQAETNADIRPSPVVLRDQDEQLQAFRHWLLAQEPAPAASARNPPAPGGTWSGAPPPS